MAGLIATYADLGLEHFILSGYPHLEEAYHFGEGVRPALARLGLIDDEAESGEAVRGAFLPTLRAASS